MSAPVDPACGEGALSLTLACMRVIADSTGTYHGHYGRYGH